MSTDLDTMTPVSNEPEFRHCISCGKQGGPWRHPGAQRCTSCDEPSVQRRKQWAKEYHAARARAVSRLVKKYHLEFEEMVLEERSKPATTRSG